MSPDTWEAIRSNGKSSFPLLKHEFWSSPFVCAISRTNLLSLRHKRREHCHECRSIPSAQRVHICDHFLITNISRSICYFLLRNLFIMNVKHWDAGNKEKIHFVFMCWANTQNYNKEIRTSSFVSGTRAKFLISDGTLSFFSATCIDETVELSPWSIATLSRWKHVEPFALISRVVSSSQLCDCLTSSKRIEIFGEDNFLASPVHIRTMHSALQRKLSWLSSERITFQWRCQSDVDDKVIRVLIKISEKSMYVLVIDTSRAPLNTPHSKHQNRTARRLKHFRFSCLKLQFSRDFWRLINRTIGISEIRKGGNHH